MEHPIVKEEGSHRIDDAAGDMIAEMTYSRTPSALIIDSTYVRDDHRGEGLGKVLMDSVVQMAREEGHRVVPLCPFAKAQVDKHPEDYADVVYQA